MWSARTRSREVHDSFPDLGGLDRLTQSGESRLPFRSNYQVCTGPQCLSQPSAIRHPMRNVEQRHRHSGVLNPMLMLPVAIFQQLTPLLPELLVSYFVVVLSTTSEHAPMFQGRANHG